MLKSIPEQADQLKSRVMEDGAVIVSPIDGQLTVVNEVGSFVWESIDGRHPVESIIQMVIDHFQVSPEQAHADVKSFLETLDQRGLIAWVQQP